MKKFMFFFMLLTFAFIYAGCKDVSSPIVTSPQSEITDHMVPVPYVGTSEGFGYVGGIATCGTGWDKMYYLGEGTASHLGVCLIRLDHCYQIQSQTGGAVQNGIGVITAANGDKLHATYSGTFEFNTYPPTMISYVCNVTISGGTGRFEDAQGTLVSEGIQDLTHTPNPTTVTWNGTITF